MAILILLGTGACSRFRYSEKVTIDQEAFDTLPPKSLAILPFSNASGVPEANELARENIYEELSKLEYQDVELSRVDSDLSKLAIAYNLEPDEIPPPLIRQSGLGDAVLTGQIEEVSKRWAIIYSHIRVVMHLELTDTRSNKTIYRNDATGTSVRFVAPISLFGIFTGAWNTIRHMRQEEIDETLEEFSQKVSEKFPNPTQTSGQGGLFIRNPNLAIPRNPLLAGDQIDVEFYGNPAMKAEMAIGGLAGAIAMPEVKPGHYRVLHSIPPGVNVEYSVVYLRLRQEPDKQVEVTLYQKPFAIRSLPSAQAATSRVAR